MASGASSLARKLDGAPAVLPPISPLIDRRKLQPSAFEPVAESLEKCGFSVGWNDGSLQVGGSLAQSGLCSPTSCSSRSSYRPRTSGFLSFSKARDAHSRQRTPGSCSSASATLPAAPLTPPLARRQHTPHERFTHLTASLDSANARSLISQELARAQQALTKLRQEQQQQQQQQQQNQHGSDAGQPDADSAAAASAVGGSVGAASTTPQRQKSPPQQHQQEQQQSAVQVRQPTPARGAASAATLPSPAKIASTMGLTIPLENLKDCERPGTGMAASQKYSGPIIQVPLGVPSPRSHQAQVAAFRATRGHVLMVFNELDSDKNGKVTQSEFEAAALSLGFSLEQAQRFWERLDRRKRGYLEAMDWGVKDAFQQIQLFATRYMQKYMGVPDVSSTPEQVRKFNRAQELMQVKSLAAAINLARTNAMARGLRSAGATGNPIYDTFRYMDVDGSGALTREEVRDAFFALGVYLSNQVIDQIMQSFDKNGSGTVQYHEFENTMFPPVRGM